MTYDKQTRRKPEISCARVSNDMSTCYPYSLEFCSIWGSWESHTDEKLPTNFISFHFPVCVTLLRFVMRQICHWSPEHKGVTCFRRSWQFCFMCLYEFTSIPKKIPHLAMELGNNVWKNAACHPPCCSPHSYKKFHVNCVSLSLEFALVTDKETTKKANHRITEC